MSIADVSNFLLKEVAIGGIYLLVGLAMLRLFEYEGRRSASLETFRARRGPQDWWRL